MKQATPPALLHVVTPSMAVIEHVLALGYDGVMIDLQHSEIGLDRACDMLRSIPRDHPYAYVRVPSLDDGDIGRLLDSGANGIIAPTIETVEQARALVASSKYPPLGNRSLGPSRPGLYVGEDYCRAGNAAVQTIAQIETATGVEAIDEILAIEGLDALYIGPADLAVTYGLAGRPDWTDGPVLDAINHVVARAQAAGMPVGLYCSDPTFAAQETQRLGLDFIGLGIDLMFMSKHARTTVETFKGNHEETL